MSMIGELVEKLRVEALWLKGKESLYGTNTRKLLDEAADTIDELSGKLQAANMKISNQFYNDKNNERKKIADALKWWQETNTENGVVTIPSSLITKAVNALERENKMTQEERRHGEWRGTVCSCCGESTSFYYDCNYCPCCGAIMDGSETTKKKERGV